MSVADIQLEAGSENTLEALLDLQDDAELVAPELREWWLDYLRSHSGHILALMEFTRRTTPDGGVVADVGSFPGHFSVLAKLAGYRVSTVDIKPDRAARFWNKYDIPFWECDVETDPLPFDSSSQDLVVLAEVLEHLRLNPFNALTEAHRSLRRGGRLLLSVPHISPRHRIRFLLGKDFQGDIVSEFKSLQEVGHMGHYRLLSRREIEAILRHTGYVVEEITVAGWLPGGRWSFVKYFGPFRNSFRSHLYVVARKVS